MKAIETRYKGYRFRSRLEARWAVFFDTLGIRWDYEPEGFETPFGPYLPDFHLRDWGLFAEVKPDVPADQRDAAGYLKAQTFAGFCGRGGILGLIGTPEVTWYPAWLPVTDWADAKPDPRGVRLEWLDFSQSMRKGRPWYFFGGPQRPSDRDLTLESGGDPFEVAVLTARGARFEHGESPVIPKIHRKKKKAPSRHDDLVGRMVRATTKEEQDKIFDAIMENSRQQQAERNARGRRT